MVINLINKIKNKINNNYLYLLFFLGVFIIHLFFNFSNDDINYFNTILDKMSLFKFISMRYNTWTSRIIIEAVLVFVSRYIYLWRFLNSLVILLLVYSINKLCFKKSNIKNISIIILLFLIYPLLDLTGAGFAACTTNYLWPLTFMLFSFIPYRNNYYKEKVNNKLWPLYILSLIYASNQEQCVCIIFIVSLIMLIFSIKNKSNWVYPLIVLIVSIISLIFIFICPGNSLRSVIEMNNWYPDYINTNIMDKIYLAIISTTSILISNGIVLWVLSLLLFLIILKIDTKVYNKILAFILLLIIMIVSVFRFINIVFGKKYIIFDYTTKVGDVFDYSFNSFLVLFLCVLLFGVVFYLLYVIFRKNSLVYIFIILLGMGTRLIMGFSPTIFVSGRRTAIFLYFSLIIVMIFLIKHFYTKFIKMERKIIIVLVLLCSIVNMGILFIKM